MAGEVCLICQNKKDGYLSASTEYKCTVCGASISWGDAVSHYMKHVKTSGNDAICGICNAKVKKADIRSHIRSHFAVKEGNRFFCGVCGREFLNEKSLFVHMMRSHE
ncbi:MAG: C2H2-type zinc finger protein [Thermoproteus sp.]